MDDPDDIEIPICFPRRTPEERAALAAQRREAELAAFRERRAKRMAELGMAPQRREP